MKQSSLLEGGGRGRGVNDIIGGSCHKYNFCHDKRRLLSRQKYACRDKMFVATNTCLSRQKLYLWQLLPMIIQSRSERQEYSLKWDLCGLVSHCPFFGKVFSTNVRTHKHEYYQANLNAKQRRMIRPILFISHEQDYAPTKFERKKWNNYVCRSY